MSNLPGAENAACTPEEEAEEARNYERCPFDWCVTDHLMAGWESDENGDPARFHDHEMPGASPSAPYLAVEESRTPTGTTWRGPWVIFADGKELPLEEGIEVLHTGLATVPLWRAIAAEISAEAAQ